MAPAARVAEETGISADGIIGIRHVYIITKRRCSIA